MSTSAFTPVYTASGDVLLWGSDLVIWGVVEAAAGVRQGLVAYTQDDYREALAALAPEGLALPTNVDSWFQRLLAALAAEMARLDARASQLSDEVDPRQTTELLGDWERMVGLPDPCVTLAQTVAQRRLALAGRLTSVGGQSRDYFIAVAMRLGYTVTIDEFASAGAATSAGVTFSGDEWAHIWRVNVAASVAVTPFRVGSGSAGEPLRAWSNEVIECQFNRLKPAHTRVLFAYSA